MSTPQILKIRDWTGTRKEFLALPIAERQRLMEISVDDLQDARYHESESQGCRVCAILQETDAALASTEQPGREEKLMIAEGNARLTRERDDAQAEANSWYVEIEKLREANAALSEENERLKRERDEARDKVEEAQGTLETAGRYLKDYHGGGTPEDVIEACHELSESYQIISDIDTKGETEGADDIPQVIEWLHAWLVEARAKPSAKDRADISTLRAKVAQLEETLDHPMLRKLFGEIEDSGTKESAKLWALCLAWFCVRDAALTRQNSIQKEGHRATGIVIPEGWIHITEGTTDRGDLVWNREHSSFEPVDSVNEYVSEYACVIRKSATLSTEAEKGAQNGR